MISDTHTVHVVISDTHTVHVVISDTHTVHVVMQLTTGASTFVTYIPPHTMEFMIEHQLLLEMSDKCLQLSCITPIYISKLIQVGKSTYSTLQKMKCERINHVKNSNGIFRMHSNFLN